MHQSRRVRLTSPVSAKRLVIATLTALCLAVPAMVYAWNTNPLCYLFSKGSIEWIVLACDDTEHNGSEG